MFDKDDGNDPELDYNEREQDQEKCDDNETEIHPQELASEERVGGNNGKELMTGIEVDNEDADHAVAVRVPPIVIHDLEI